MEFACSFSTPVPGDRVAVAFFLADAEPSLDKGGDRAPLGLPGGRVAPRAGLMPPQQLAPPGGGAPRHGEGRATRSLCTPFDLGLSLLPAVPQFPPLSELVRCGVLTQTVEGKVVLPIQLFVPSLTISGKTSV